MQRWVPIGGLVIASALIFTATTFARPLHANLVQARVLSMHVVIGHSSYAATGGIDVVTLQIENPSRRKYVSVMLLAFRDYRIDAMPTVIKVSEPASYVPKPDRGYPFWLFRLRKGEVKTVVFTIRTVGDNSYCIGGSDYQTGTGLYTLCRPQG